MNDMESKLRHRLLDYADIFLNQRLISQIDELYRTIRWVLQQNRKLLLCGNGGSAADCQHIAGEFVGRLKKEREAWPALSLCMDPSVLTCLSNDYSFNQVFKRPIEAFGEPGDLLIALSTSGNSENIRNAIETAKTQKILTCLITNCNGGAAASSSDKTRYIPTENTQVVQEVTITIFHILCGRLENEKG